MLNRSKKLTVSGYKAIARLSRPLTGLVLGLGIIIASTPDLSAQAADGVPVAAVAISNQRVAVRSVGQPQELGQQLVSEALSVNGTAFPENGVYLYGQSPEPEQVGAAYAVMEIVDNQAVGAFYMPQSSFDCFYGAVESNQLMLNVVSSYDQQTHEYALAFQDSTAIATTEEAAAPMELMGYHPIETVSSNDHRMLGVCRTDMAGRL